MPRADFSAPEGRWNASFPTAHDASDLASWVRKIRKYIPQLPDLPTELHTSQGHWTLHDIYTSTVSGMVTLMWVNNLGQKCALTIDRRFNHVTGT